MIITSHTVVCPGILDYSVVLVQCFHFDHIIQDGVVSTLVIGQRRFSKSEKGNIERGDILSYDKPLDIYFQLSSLPFFSQGVILSSEMVLLGCYCMDIKTNV